MDKMIDSAIELGRIDTAIKMEWVKLAYEQTGDVDTAFTEMLELQKQ